MKPFRKILILAVIVTAIVTFWLIPGVNKANYSGYVRVYEDTDQPIKALPQDTVSLYLPVVKPDIEAPKKIYKKERIKGDASLEDLKVEMFSRATHFREEELLIEPELVLEDTTDVQQYVVKDSLQLVQPDTIASIR